LAVGFGASTLGAFIITAGTILLQKTRLSSKSWSANTSP
jgi:hypothetical protein